MRNRFWHVTAALLLAGAALLLLGRWARAVSAARPSVAFSVDNTSDLPDDNLGDGHCHAATGAAHKCTLRAAVQELNAGSGGAIFLPAGPFTLTDSAGDLQLLKDIQIYGYPFNPTVIQGNPAGWSHRILRVQNNASVMLSSVVISGGYVPALAGGGIDVVSGTLRLDHSQLTHNQAGLGGGLYNQGITFMSEVTVNANIAYTAGAGLYNAARLFTGDALQLSLSTVRDNHAQGNATGGGLYNLGFTHVDSTTFALNSALAGGGVDDEAGSTLVMNSSTLYQNEAASGSGGGLLNSGAGALAEINNSTLASNSALLGGGGAANAAGADLRLSSVTVADNHVLGNGQGGGLSHTGASFVLRNTLVANNTNPAHNQPDCSGIFDSRDYNLVENTTGCSLTNNLSHNVTGHDPQLGSWGLAGGTTAVWPLTPGSLAVDAGNPAGCVDGDGLTLASDQRGAGRHLDGDQDGAAVCDIGAFELKLARAFLPVVWR